jgi:hypothetical protein
MKKATGAGDLQGCRKLEQRMEQLPSAQKCLTYPVAFARTRCRRQWKLVDIDRKFVGAEMGAADLAPRSFSN